MASKYSSFEVDGIRYERPQPALDGQYIRELFSLLPDCGDVNYLKTEDAEGYVTWAYSQSRLHPTRCLTCWQLGGLTYHVPHNDNTHPYEPIGEADE